MQTNVGSPRQQLTELQHPGLRALVLKLRTAGESWRRIERAVYRETAGQVDVSFETLRAWFGESR